MKITKTNSFSTLHLTVDEEVADKTTPAAGLQFSQRDAASKIRVQKGKPGTKNSRSPLKRATEYR